MRQATPTRRACDVDDGASRSVEQRQLGSHAVKDAVEVDAQDLVPVMLVLWQSV